MKTTFATRARRWPKTMGTVLALALTLTGASAHAQQVTCSPGGLSPVNLDVDFGTHTPGMNNDAASATGLTISCANSGQSTRNVKICVGLGIGSGGGSFQLRRMINGTRAIRYQIYSNAARTQLFRLIPNGAEFIASIGGYTLLPLTTPIRLYGRIPVQSSLVSAGTYTSTFTSADVQIRYKDYDVESPEPPCAGGEVMPYDDSFTVQVHVPPSCQITTPPPPVNFGSHAALAGNIDRNVRFRVLCTSGTSYEIALDDGQHAQGGNQRYMRLGNTPNRIEYGLYRNSAYTLRWGSTAAERLQATGNGFPQIHTVYARVPGGQTIPAVGEYKDTVVLTVHY